MCLSIKIPARAIIFVNTLITLLISEQGLKRSDDQDGFLKNLEFRPWSKYYKTKCLVYRIGPCIFEEMKLMTKNN